MKFHEMLPFRVAIAALAFPMAVNAISQQYCSNQNTGSSFAAVYDIYQSDGACQSTCQSQYAFAIVQSQNCWCSNYAPANQVDVSQCNQGCPGYPDDLCGNANAGLYGYIALNIAPSGTSGASSSHQQTSTKAQTSSTTSTSTPTSYTPSTTSTTSTTSIVAYTSSSSIQTQPSSTALAVTSVQVITVSGAPVTQTVTSTPKVALSQDASVTPLPENKLSGGAIAGIVIGVLLGLAAILLAIFLLWRRSQQKRDESEKGTPTVAAGGGKPHNPKRNTSVLSRSGLLSKASGGDSNEKDYDDVYANNGSNSQRHSMLFGAAAASGEGVSPVSPLGSSQDGDSRRHSKPLVYDQRLNPSALFGNHDLNGSRVSMQDGADYSRPLGVTNPDPRASFDSRFSRA